MPNGYTGGCACGALRYRAKGEPVFSAHCQCRDCQQTSGTGHSSLVIFPASAVERSGIAATWSKNGDSGKAKSHVFCPTCGAPVYITVEIAPDAVAIHAASLDEPARFKPQAITYAKSGLAWDVHDAALAKFERLPPG